MNNTSMQKCLLFELHLTYARAVELLPSIDEKHERPHRQWESQDTRGGSANTFPQLKLNKAGKDTLSRMNTKLRGHCYDGASVMSGSKSNIAKQIQDEEPKALVMDTQFHMVQ